MIRPIYRPLSYIICRPIGPYIVGWQTLLSSKSIEENWSTFKDEYEKLCDKRVPTKTVRVGETRKPPWLNYNVVKKARKRKNTMWEKFKQSKLT